MEDITSIAAMFVAAFNEDLAALKSPARVGLAPADNPEAVVELHDEQGAFLCFVPNTAAPEMVDIAYRLYVHGLGRGLIAGEQTAWAKLRLLIGAAADLDG